MPLTPALQAEGWQVRRLHAPQHLLRASRSQKTAARPWNFPLSAALSSRLSRARAHSQEVKSGGSTYYFNSKTQVTSWELPGGAAARAPQVPARLPIGMAGATSAGDGSLPAGWDAISGPSGTYYFNKTTKETTWTKPGGPATVAPVAPSFPGAPPRPVTAPLPAAPAGGALGVPRGFVFYVS